MCVLPLSPFMMTQILDPTHLSMSSGVGSWLLAGLGFILLCGGRVEKFKKYQGGEVEMPFCFAFFWFGFVSGWLLLLPVEFQDGWCV